MPSRRFITEQNAFSGGILGDELYSRYDLEIYYQGAATLENVVVQPQGGIKRRPGEEFVTDMGGERANLEQWISRIAGSHEFIFPFLFSEEEKYFIRLDWSGTSVIDNNWNVSITNLGSGGDLASRPVVFTLETVPSTGAQIRSGLATPPRNELFINYEQYGDTMFLCGDLHTIYKITRRIVNHDDLNADTARGRKLKLLFDDNNDANIGKYFFEVEELRIKNSNEGGASLQKWRDWDEARNGDNPFGTPRTVTLHGGRLWLGGFKGRESRNRIIASRAGDLFTFNLDAEDPQDDDAIEISLRARSNEPIAHLVSAGRLIAFTTTDEWAISDEVITHKNAFFIQQSSYGAYERVKPLAFGDKLLFVQHDGRSVYEMRWNGDTSKFNSAPVSERVPGIVNNPISLTHEVGAAEDTADRIYIVNKDGTVAVLTLLETQQVKAWSMFPLIYQDDEGTPIRDNIAHVTKSSRETEDEFQKRLLARREEAVSGVAGMHTIGDETYVIRAVNDELKLFINRLTSDKILIAVKDPNEQAWKPGKPIQGNETPERLGRVSWYDHTSRASGIDRYILDGEDVKNDPNIPTDGDIEYGLDCPIKVETMPLNPTYQQKSTQYRLKRVIRLFVETIGAHTLQAEYLRKKPFPLITAQQTDDFVGGHIFALRDGTTEKRFYGYRRNAQIIFTQPQPGPLHINGYALEIQSAFTPTL